MMEHLLLIRQFTGDGSTVAFTLSQDPKSENNTQIYINGVYQQKTDYTVTGTTLAFDTAPDTGDIIEVNMFTVATLGNTDTVNEGVSNLYHTTARARSAISVSGNALSYNSSTGVITSPINNPSFTGNVGIGGTISSGAITTSGTFTVDSSSLVIKDAGTSAIQMVAAAGDELYIGGNNSYALRFLSDGTNNVVFDNSSNVGIGTASPATNYNLL